MMATLNLLSIFTVDILELGDGLKKFETMQLLAKKSSSHLRQSNTRFRENDQLVLWVNQQWDCN